MTTNSTAAEDRLAKLGIHLPHPSSQARTAQCAGDTLTNDTCRSVMADWEAYEAARQNMIPNWHSHICHSTKTAAEKDH